jgi:hypothetical protein
MPLATVDSMMRCLDLGGGDEDVDDGSGSKQSHPKPLTSYYIKRQLDTIIYVHSNIDTFESN